MKRILKPIGLFGLFYLISGTVLNFRMYVIEAWPTGLFFVLIFVGLVFMGLSLLNWNFKGKNPVQVILGLIPIVLIVGPQFI